MSTQEIQGSFIPRYPPPSLKLLYACTPVEMAELCALLLPRIWSPGSKRRPAYHYSLKAYFRMLFRRFRKYCYPDLVKLDPMCILVAFYYLHQMRSLHPNVCDNKGSEIHFIVTAIIIAHKYHPDRIFFLPKEPKMWSAASQIPYDKLVKMEMEFMQALDYRLNIKREEFFKWAVQCQHFLGLIAKKKNWSPVQVSEKELSESLTFEENKVVIDYYHYAAIYL